jgi:hypothetical protein
MALKKKVGSLARTGVATAIGAVRHPFGTASQAVDLVKDTAELGVSLVRSHLPGGSATTTDSVQEATAKAAQTVVEQTPEPVKKAADKMTQKVADQAPAPVKEAAEKTADAATDEAPAEEAPAKKTAAKKAPAKKAPATKTTAKKAAAKKPAEDPRDQIPGPDLAAFEPPAPEDLPEPVVIVADDDAGTPGEAFQNEPKAATRESARGGTGDREENSGYVEEIVLPDVDPDVDIETPVGTTGADVGTNPDTAESDLQQPGTPPLLDPSTVKAVESEQETLRKAADPNKG